MRDEGWLEEKRTERPYFHSLQIRKGFDPRTLMATLKER
ncbi:False CDS [Vibrio diabolicus]|nr:False CDS [Vibrio diabolicus]